MPAALSRPQSITIAACPASAGMVSASESERAWLRLLAKKACQSDSPSNWPFHVGPAAAQRIAVRRLQPQDLRAEVAEQLAGVDCAVVGEVEHSDSFEGGGHDRESRPRSALVRSAPNCAVLAEVPDGVSIFGRGRGVSRGGGAVPRDGAPAGLGRHVGGPRRGGRGQRGTLAVHADIPALARRARLADAGLADRARRRRRRSGAPGDVQRGDGALSRARLQPGRRPGRADDHHVRLRRAQRVLPAGDSQRGDHLVPGLQ